MSRAFDGRIDHCGRGRGFGRSGLYSDIVSGTSARDPVHIFQKAHQAASPMPVTRTQAICAPAHLVQRASDWEHRSPIPCHHLAQCSRIFLGGTHLFPPHTRSRRVSRHRRPMQPPPPCRSGGKSRVLCRLRPEGPRNPTSTSPETSTLGRWVALLRIFIRLRDIARAENGQDFRIWASGCGRQAGTGSTLGAPVFTLHTVRAHPCLL